MAGYTRQSAATIVNGQPVDAEPVIAELDALASAFSGATGHGHTGGSGDGKKIPLSSSVSGYLAAENGGTGGLNNVSATTDPTATDDNEVGYAAGSKWVNVNSGAVFICVSNPTAAAVWVRLLSAVANVFQATGSLFVTSDATSTIPVRVAASAGQTADLTRWLSDSDATLAKVDAAGGAEFLSVLLNDVSSKLQVKTTTDQVGAGNTNTGISLFDDALWVSRSDFAAASFNRSTSDGTLMTFRRDGAIRGSVSVTTTATTYNTTSDKRLKRNISDAYSPGDIIDRIRVAQFDWSHEDRQVDYGFIAQELNEVYPEAVTEGGENAAEEPWAVDNSKLVPVLLKEIQDLRKRVSELELS